jgi:hypothetical protein
LVSSGFFFFKKSSFGMFFTVTTKFLLYDPIGTSTESKIEKKFYSTGRVNAIS